MTGQLTNMAESGFKTIEYVTQSAAQLTQMVFVVNSAIQVFGPTMQEFVSDVYVQTKGGAAVGFTKAVRAMLSEKQNFILAQRLLGCGRPSC